MIGPPAGTDGPRSVLGRHRGPPVPVGSMNRADGTRRLGPCGDVSVVLVGQTDRADVVGGPGSGRDRLRGGAVHPPRPVGPAPVQTGFDQGPTVSVLS